jgi:hypothetical protein
MARRKQLQQLVADLRVETGRSTSVALGVDEEQRLKTTLARVQETLYDDYDWPFLRVKPTKALAAGQRYYDMPTGLNLDRIEELAVWYNSEPFPIERGIGFAEYSVYRSDDDERSDPVLKWDVVDNDGDEQIEVWPLPVSNDQTLQFIGIRDLTPLVDNEDRADLDDQLIVLFAAAELLANQKSEDAQAKLGAAQERYARLKGRSKGASRDAIIGGGKADRRILTRATIVVS